MKILRGFTYLEVVIFLILVTTLLELSAQLLRKDKLSKESRDLLRVNDLSKLENILKSFLLEDPRISLGRSNYIYLSLPSKSATTNCQVDYPDLPDPPQGYQYYCSSDPSNINGNGWIPVNFSQNPILRINNLPTDPINDINYFYAFFVSTSGKEFELIANLESEKNKGIDSISGKDNGTAHWLLEFGNNKNLAPMDFELALLPSGEIMWAFSENWGNLWDDIEGLALDNDYIYLVGDNKVNENDNWRWVIQKRKKLNGEIIWSTISDPNPYYNTYDFDSVFGGVIEDRDYIYIGGRQGRSGVTGRLEKRDKINGSLVSAVNISSMETVWSMAQDSNYIYLAGWNRRTVYTSAGGTSDYYWVITKLNKSDLTAVQTIQINPHTPYAACSSGYTCLCFDYDIYPQIVVKDSYLYIGGYVGNFNWNNPSCGSIYGRLEKRDINNLNNLISYATSNKPFVSLDLDNSGNIYVMTGERLEKRNSSNLSLLGSLNNISGKIRVFDKYIYTITSIVEGGDRKWRILKIQKDNLNIIWDKIENPSDQEDYPNAIAVDSSGIYIGGIHRISYYDSQVRIEKRNK